MSAVRGAVLHKAVCIAIAALASMAGPALAQSDHARVAVPYYRPADAMQGLYRGQLAPRARAFEQQAQALQPALRDYCANTQPLAAARQQWLATLDAWERLAALPLGPLIERRSLRQIDFQPTRPELIIKAIARQPAQAADLERIGTPARGLPALEWLLWTRPAAPGAPACDYARLLADDLLREAQALRSAFDRAAAEDWDETRGDTAFAEFINQWVGGVERLRWVQIDKPRREAASRGRAPAYTRQASGQTAASWARQWQVLHDAAVFRGAAAPVPGEAAVSIETYLRGRGLNPLADRWLLQLQRSQAAMQSIKPGPARPLDAAVRSLARTKALAESDIAPALEVSIGFSDADGD